MKHVSGRSHYTGVYFVLPSTGKMLFGLYVFFCCSTTSGHWKQIVALPYCCHIAAILKKKEIANTFGLSQSVRVFFQCWKAAGGSATFPLFFSAGRFWMCINDEAVGVAAFGRDFIVGGLRFAQSGFARILILATGSLERTGLAAGLR